MRRPSPVTQETAGSEGAEIHPAGGHLLWLAADLLLVLAFAIAGRRTHEHGLSIGGVLETAWPFLVAYAIAAGLTRAWTSPAALWPTGIVLWLGTVAGGLALRAASGGGVAPSFQLVTVVVLGVFLILPRVVARLTDRRRRRQPVA